MADDWGDFEGGGSASADGTTSIAGSDWANPTADGCGQPGEQAGPGPAVAHLDVARVLSPDGLQSELAQLFLGTERGDPGRVVRRLNPAAPISVPDLNEAGDFVWHKSMTQLLLYAQIGVAVPRYELERKRRKSLISDARHRFASPIRGAGSADGDGEVVDDTEDAAGDASRDLTFRRRSSSSNMVGKATTAMLDGLLAGVTATTSAVAKTAQGIGAAGSAVGAAVTAPVRVVARAVQGSRGPTPPEGVEGDGSSMFHSTLAGLSLEEKRELGIVAKASLSEEELSTVAAQQSIKSENYVLMSDEARILAEKMRKMELALREEETELAQQARILEIERKENELYPEGDPDKEGEAIVGNDGFSKEMEANGLRHIQVDGSERRIRHADLPQEFDLFAWTADNATAVSSALGGGGAAAARSHTASTGGELPVPPPSSPKVLSPVTAGSLGPPDDVLTLPTTTASDA